MDWERGLLRLWVLLSGLWIIGVGVIFHEELAGNVHAWSELGPLPAAAPGGQTDQLNSVDFLRRTGILIETGRLLALLFGPPVVVLFLGLGLAWMYGKGGLSDPAHQSMRVPRGKRGDGRS